MNSLPPRENGLILFLLLSLTAPFLLTEVAGIADPIGSLWMTLVQGPGDTLRKATSPIARLFPMTSWFVRSWGEFVPFLTVILGFSGLIRARRAAAAVAAWSLFDALIQGPGPYLGRGPDWPVWEWVSVFTHETALPGLMAVYPRIANLAPGTKGVWGIKLTRAVLILSGAVALVVNLTGFMGVRPGELLFYLTWATWPCAAITTGLLLFRERQVRRWLWWVYLALICLWWLVTVAITCAELRPFSLWDTLTKVWVAKVALGSLGPLFLAGTFTWYWWPVLRSGGHVRGQMPECECCGYNLTGNVSGVCPECGAAVVGKEAKAG